MTQVTSHLTVHPVHVMNVEQRHKKRLQTLRPSQLTWAAVWSPPEGCYCLHPPSSFIVTQPESWYSFYHPTEARRRLSQPGHTGSMKYVMTAFLIKILCQKLFLSAWRSRGRDNKRIQFSMQMRVSGLGYCFYWSYNNNYNFYTAILMSKS